MKVFLTIIISAGAIYFIGKFLTSKWMMQNGFGSPGSTTKALVELYKEISIFSILYDRRKNTVEGLGFKGSLYSSINSLEVIEYAQGDLRLFVFQMMCLETKRFRKTMLTYNTFSQVTDIIHEIILKEAPEAITISNEEFGKRALSFVFKVNPV